MGPRRRQHGPLQRDFVIGVVRRCVRRRPEVRNGLIKIASFHGGIPVAERLARGTSGADDDGCYKKTEMEEAAPHIALEFVKRTQKSCLKCRMCTLMIPTAGWFDVRGHPGKPSQLTRRRCG